MIDASPYDLLGVGFGPSNLAIAAQIASMPAATAAGKRVGFLENRPRFTWHPDMLLDGARMQIAFLKDLVTLTNPTSPLTFLNYLHEEGRLEDFLNLKTFYPTRTECHDYFGWAARKLRRFVRYGCEVTALLPRIATNGAVDLVEVHYRDNERGEEGVGLARNIALSVGGQMNLPAGIAPASLDDRLFHSAQFLSRVRRFEEEDRSRPWRFLVVGGGQSAAEVFQYLVREFPAASVTLAVRRFALMPSDSSPFSNEIFNSGMVDFFFDLPDARKREVLRELHHTNYAAVEAEVIELIFATLYEQKVRKRERHRLLRMHELASCERRPEGVRVALRDLAAERTESDVYDAVVLATGYDFSRSQALLADLDPYLKRLPGGELALNRDYSVDTVDAMRARVYVQGATEHSHGLTSTLLSILPYRARDILTSAFGTDRADSVVSLAREGQR